MTNSQRQSVRNAWVNALRAETLRERNRAQATVALVGHMIATYTDADGGGAFPSRETLALLCGCTTETVSRAVAVLTAVGMLARKRRPNSPMVYQLLLPVSRPDWDSHMPAFTETRQKRARAAAKERLATELEAALAGTAPTSRTASPDAIRTASPAGLPDSVPGRHPKESDSVPGRPRLASPDAIRTASPAGGTRTPTSGRDQDTHHTLAGHVQQPQHRAPDPRTDDPQLLPPDWTPSTAAIEAAQSNRTAAGRPVLTGSELITVTRRFRSRVRADHWLTTPDAANARWITWVERERSGDADQPPLLLSLPGGQHHTTTQPAAPNTPARHPENTRDTA
ncbi:helix-turn-helix domain-containing protein [Kitasatospora viridis]|uniref:Helix-turn-helix protein n=1 Tax=Kitasatospora viridis TaxID=281105 RepID=A0A561UKR5_9ACTN|nr:helix-turn-helix domain-containing protein [Kitasatospora viridis]TWF99949.1 helix-turn-helix protein [Kitasatospora viridis]